MGSGSNSVVATPLDPGLTIEMEMLRHCRDRESCGKKKKDVPYTLGVKPHPPIRPPFKNILGGSIRQPYKHPLAN
jgi:hypothetical protein